MRRGWFFITISVAFFLVWGGRLSLANAPEPEPGVPENRYYDPSSGSATLALGKLREFNEISIFILKRYATLEALITAVEQGKESPESFWIGGASLVPGVGQLINHDNLQGGLLLFSTGLAWSTVQQLDYTHRQHPAGKRWLPWYYAALTIRNGIMTYSTLHAANAQYRARHDRTSAMWTGAASIIPGVGQAINGDWWSAAAFFAAWTASAGLTGYLEEAVFPDGDTGYLVQHAEPNWSLAWLPGGASLTFTTTW